MSTWVCNVERDLPPRLGRHGARWTLTASLSIGILLLWLAALIQEHTHNAQRWKSTFAGTKAPEHGSPVRSSSPMQPVAISPPPPSHERKADFPPAGPQSRLALAHHGSVHQAPAAQPVPRSTTHARPLQANTSHPGSAKQAGPSRSAKVKFARSVVPVWRIDDSPAVKRNRVRHAKLDRRRAGTPTRQPRSAAALRLR